MDAEEHHNGKCAEIKAEPAGVKLETQNDFSDPDEGADSRVALATAQVRRGEVLFDLGLFELAASAFRNALAGLTSVYGEFHDELGDCLALYGKASLIYFNLFLRRNKFERN